MLDFGVTFLITLVNLTVLFLILRKVLFGRVTKFMDDRSERISRQLNEAQGMKRRAEEMKDQYEALLGNAENESEWVVRDAEDRGKERYDAIVSEANREADLLRRRERERMLQEARKARDDFSAETAKLAIFAAAEIIERSMDSDDQLRMAEKFVRQAQAGGRSRTGGRDAS